MFLRAEPALSFPGYEMFPGYESRYGNLHRYVPRHLGGRGKDV